MIGMKLEGGQQLAKALGNLSLSQERSKMTTLLKTAAEPMRAAMEAHAPVAPGEPDIKANIVISPATKVSDEPGAPSRAREDSETAVAVGPSKDFPYGIPLEFGHVTVGKSPHFVEARPFARPAFDTTQDRTLRLVQDGIWNLLRSLTDKSPTGGSGGTL